MEPINYIGEYLLPRYLGHFAILLGFLAAAVSTISYFLATQRRNTPINARHWTSLGRAAFVTHSAAVFLAIGLIFYLMLGKYYEYQYVQAHVSDELANRYIFSAFWEGQEGSFLLWLFWHVVLGLVLIFTAKRWESPVLAVVSSVQLVIMSMLLGVYVGVGEFSIKLGSNPLLLLREVFDAPLFLQADYVEMLPRIAQGLNPSLQNYWMTIHPPTLFLGFASTVVPFAFAIAGLWTKEHKAWLQPALKWSLFSAAVLGTGILMGGAWAYEALNFGGYWAWDPVENTSLVPWILLVAGIHTNLIARATGQGIRSTYIYYLLGFVLIVYSTFLTRSGILGDTSVHAFTEMGLESQLLFFLGFFALLAIGMLAKSWRSIPQPVKEESAASKEFWMFIGSLVLLMSAVLITGATSLPVFNEIMLLFDPIWEPLGLDDPEAHHNRYQLWVAVFIGMLSAAAQFLRWREHDFGQQFKLFGRHTAAALVVAAILTVLTLTWIEAYSWQYKLLVFAGWYTVVSNIDYLISFARRDLKLAGSGIAHFGFGIMLIGIMASGPNQRILSKNQFLMEGLSDDEELQRTTLLLFKDTPQVMENYRMTFTGDTIDNFTRTYFVKYEELDVEGRLVDSFQLEPTILYDRDFSKIAITNPSTKNYWNKDIFTVIMSLPEEETSIEAKQTKEDSLSYRLLPLAIGESRQMLDTLQLNKPDTAIVRTYDIRLLGFKRGIEHPDYKAEPKDIGVSASVQVAARHKEKVETAQIAIVLREGLLFQFPAQLNDLSMRLKIDESVFDQLLIDETKLEYKEIKARPGESIQIGGQQLRFLQFTPKPQVDHYQAMPDDIAVSALLETKDEAGNTHRMEPVLVIRDRQAVRARDEIRELGIYANFVNLDPATNEATFYIAKTDPPPPLRIPLAIATKSSRADWIAIQAIEFPGINLFWWGSILMLVGLGFSMLVRLQERQQISLAEDDA